MKSATFAALALAFAALFAGCDSGPEKLKVGVAGPMTGTDAAFGAQLKNGVEQAVTDGGRPQAHALRQVGERRAAQGRVGVELDAGL